MKKILILDVESTGLQNHTFWGHPQVIELAYYDVTEVAPRDLKSIDLKNLSTFRQLYKPSMEIHPQATAIHGYKMEDLLGEPSSEELKLPELQYIIGHNISYDKRCLGQPSTDLICTLGLVKNLQKYKKDLTFDNNKLDTIIVKLFPEEAKTLVCARHSALADCTKVLLFLTYLIELFPKVETWEDIFNLQETLKKLKA